MSSIQSVFLRRVIGLDAAACAASGALMAFAAGPLEGFTGLPPAIVQPAGIFLLAWAVVLAVIASRPAIARPVVWTLIGVNVLWVVESVMLLVMGWVQPTSFGYAFVIAQAAAVALIADLQFVGLKRAQAAA